MLPCNQMLKKKRIILWFRNDLRIHDNVILNYAATKHRTDSEILPVFCFDPRFFTKQEPKWGTRKCGIVRTKFIIESVENLRKNLQEKVESQLLVSMEKPEDFISSLMRHDRDNHVVYQSEICSEE